MRGGGGEGGDGGDDVVTLAALLKCRGTPLTEEETWALLAATATTVQDALLSDEGVCDVVVCPEGVALRRCGRVEVLATSAHAHSHCLPPNEEQHDGERVLVFSLGRTLWEAAGQGGGGGVSPSLRSTLAAMTHSLPAHRLALVDIFQLLVERLDTRSSLNYTATVRALHEEASGVPSPPSPAPRTFWEARGRSYSALDPRTSTSRNLSRASGHSVSVEDLRTSHLSLSVVHTPESLPRSTSTMEPNRVAPRPAPRTSLHEGQISKEAEERSLVRAKRTFHSLGSLSITKENLAPATNTPGGSSSTSACHMNPIQEAPQGRVLEQNNPPGKDPGGGEPKATVTVGRSATVAGDMKVHG